MDRPDPSRDLRIVVVEPDRDRALMIVDALRAAGSYEAVVVGQTSGLARRVAEAAPDLVLIDLASPSRDVIEELALASSPMERPVALFVDESEEGLAAAAIDAGLSAYVVAGLTGERIKPVLDAAIARFGMIQRMRAELEATRRALEERKVIDRAKGVLMKARGIPEDEAYALLRRTAMSQNKRLAEVAQALVTAADLLG
ncbi:ANTAR domain-containing protein [Jannaschia sp. Os4]|nr:ANTAR domain-containing protein [Jannaschia sp. Os4]